MDVFSKAKRSNVMSHIRSSNNKDTELRIISFFQKNSIVGWRRKWKLLGKPDFVFPRKKIAMFIDGCFWHGCPKHGRIPNSNVKYWHNKITRNKIRDRFVTRYLRAHGWHVLRIWEHELGEANKKQLLRRLQRII